VGKKYTDEMWKEAKKKARLNDQTIQMAKELELSPKSIIKNIPNKNQRWKSPVHEWIRDMYEDRFGSVTKSKKKKKMPLKIKELIEGSKIETEDCINTAIENDDDIPF